MTAAIDITTEQRKVLLALLRRFIPGVAVWAYGSRVKWTARPNSDLDLVAFTTPAQRHLVSELKDELAESNLPFLVDLHVWEEVPERFHEIIRKEYVVVQEAKEKQTGCVMAGDAFIDCTVGELAAQTRNALVGGPFGSDLVSKDYVRTGVPVIRGTNMGHGRWVDGEFVYVTPEKADSLSSNCAKPGDIVFTQRGTLGQVALVPKKGADRYLISQSQMKLTVDAMKADAVFLYYVFTSAEQQDYIRQNAIQTGVPHTNLGILRNTPLALPPLAEQRGIAGVLGALDDKIEQNRRTAHALERLARAIFRAWFVDFEPVKAKAAGAAAFPSMPQEVFDALPTRCVDSDLGPVPEGWEVKPATGVAAVAIGKTPPRKEPQWFTSDPSQMPWVSIRDMGACGAFIGTTSEYLTREAVERFRVRRIPDRSVLYSFKLTLGRVTIADGEITSNEAIAHFIPNSPDSIGTEYLYCYLIGFDHNQLGSTSSIATATNSKIVKELPVLVPTSATAEAFTALTRPMFNALRSLTRESSRLAEMRDYLLPKLISGELRTSCSGAFAQEMTL